MTSFFVNIFILDPPEGLFAGADTDQGCRLLLSRQ